MPDVQALADEVLAETIVIAERLVLEGRGFGTWEHRLAEGVLALVEAVRQGDAEREDLETFAREVTKRYPTVAGHVIRLLDEHAPENEIEAWNDWCKAVLALESRLTPARAALPLSHRGEPK